MSTSPPSPSPAQGPTDNESPPTDSSGNCQTCDLAEIEHLACTAKRFARQAEVMNEVATDLETYRTQYDEARGKYSDAKTAAETAIASVWEVLNELAEQLRCRLTDDQRDCLEKARDEVFEKIDECSGPRGCQSPCEDRDAGGLDTSEDIEAIAADIERRRRNLAESAAYFAVLIAEPGLVQQQAEALRAEATQLATDVGAGGDAAKAVRWYARWLILEKATTMERLGHGFATVAAYTDCLCVVLRCLVSGWTVLAVLEGRKAELDCYAQGHAEACEKLKADVLQAILEAYECCISKKPGAEEPGCPEPEPQTPSQTAS